MALKIVHPLKVFSISKKTRDLKRKNRRLHSTSPLSRTHSLPQTTKEAWYSSLPLSKTPSRSQHPSHPAFSHPESPYLSLQPEPFFKRTTRKSKAKSQMRKKISWRMMLRRQCSRILSLRRFSKGK